jgi:hypothetical protein
MYETILYLTNQEHQLFAGYFFGYPLDPYVVLSPTNRELAGYGFWMQPTEDSSMGYIQPVRLATCA